MQIDEAKLRMIFQSHPHIQAVYLFGSVAKGTETALSDIDLAIVANGPVSSTQQLALLTDLARHSYCDVDLVYIGHR